MPLRYIVRVLAVLLCLGLFLFATYYCYFYYQERPETNAVLPLLPPPQNQTRLLVIAPHCDDETLGCAGLIQDVLLAGGQVTVVIMTNGDGFTFAAEEQFHRLFLTSMDYIQSGYARQKETVHALRRLGVPENQLVFLGYPDRGLRAIWSEHWDSSQPYQSRYTGSNHSPYNNSYQLNAPYIGQAVLANLKQILQDFRPTLILSPHPADEHPDHAATWAFVAASVAGFGGTGAAPDAKLYTYLVHRGDFPIPHGYDTKAVLLPPKPLYQSHSAGWRMYPISSEQEVIKEQALKEYVSQLKVPIMSSLLYSFIRRNELFEEVSVPVIEQRPPDVDLASLDVWQNQQPILVNPRGVNPLGALESKAGLAAIGSAVQNNAVWLRFHIPGFSGSYHQYNVSLVEFWRRPEKLEREKRSFYFSTADTDISIGDVIRYQDDVIVRVPYTLQGLPDFFFIQVLTKDPLGGTTNHTVWQPMLVRLKGL